MKIYPDDLDCRQSLLPFSATRHVADLRIGILTIREKWMLLLGTERVTNKPTEDCVHIPANIVPNAENYEKIIRHFSNGSNPLPDVNYLTIEYPWQIFQYNDQVLRDDYKIVTSRRVSANIPATVQCINPADVFIEEGAVLAYCMLNASTGPIYIGKHSTVMEGSLIRGPFSLGENSVVKMGSKIYGATTTGPHCVVGGEIKNTVIFGYSNKAHDGYLGDSVIGEWCNIGAGSSNSNVKNTGGEAAYDTGVTGNKLNAGQKAGLLMGDYSRCAINTSFHTASTVGVCCHIFGEITAPKFIPDFTWGQNRYEFDKALKDIRNWKNMKGQILDDSEINNLKKLYQQKK